jgi:hypothetical protein
LGAAVVGCRCAGTGNESPRPSDDLRLLFNLARRAPLEAGGDQMLLHRMDFY